MTTTSRLFPQHPSPRGLRVVIAGHTEVEGVEREAGRLGGLLERSGHAVCLRLVPRGGWGVGSFLPETVTGVDLVLVLGGDGSILRTARWMGYDQVPVLGFNLGSLGFLADSSIHEAEETLSDIAAGRFRLI
ncbi:MAG: NAD(+)/NADH kinase, partial [Planctomycetia bacterium]